jgi:hypothetical protein
MAMNKNKTNFKSQMKTKSEKNKLDKALFEIIYLN